MELRGLVRLPVEQEALIFVQYLVQLQLQVQVQYVLFRVPVGSTSNGTVVYRCPRTWYSS